MARSRLRRNITLSEQSGPMNRFDSRLRGKIIDKVRIHLEDAGRARKSVQKDGNVLSGGFDLR